MIAKTYNKSKRSIIFIVSVLMIIAIHYTISNYNTSFYLRKVIRHYNPLFNISSNNDQNLLITSNSNKKYKKKYQNPNSDEGRELLAKNIFNQAEQRA